MFGGSLSLESLIYCFNGCKDCQIIFTNIVNTKVNGNSGTFENYLPVIWKSILKDICCVHRLLFSADLDFNRLALPSLRGQGGLWPEEGRNRVLDILELWYILELFQ